MSEKPTEMGLAPRRRRHLAFIAAITLASLALIWVALDFERSAPLAVALLLALTGMSMFWASAGALNLGLGALPPRRAAAAAPGAMTPDAQAPDGPCAVLWFLCGEDPVPLAARARELIAGLDATGQTDVEVWVLSDTSDPMAVAREHAVFAPLAPRLTWRNRRPAEGKKPGNLRHWLLREGARFQTMLPLDADSGFAADRLLALRCRMSADPGVALIQAGLRARVGTSRLAEYQRLSVRLFGPAAVRGLARMSGGAAPWFGHNALIRVKAFAEVAELPELPGRAPWGGPLLSHDFAEAAFLARAGWRVEIDPDMLGSLESAPEGWEQLARRDRRWAQGNLQHLRLLALPGLRTESRLMFLGGALAYLSAPAWLVLLLLYGSGAVALDEAALGAWAGVFAVLVGPKLLAAGTARRLTPARRRVRRRALATEIALGTLLAPLLMVRQTIAVLEVLAGRDSGWRPSGVSGPGVSASGRIEAGAGVALLAAMALPQLMGPANAAEVGAAMLMALPVAGPLLVAPWLIAWIDAPARRPGQAVADYYNASTRRFLRVGGSGAALAIHRPLWDDGVTDPAQAAARINALVAEVAEAALGQAPQHVSDLGCGVGGTLFHLAGHWPAARFTGVTISAVQVRLARSLARARGLAGRCEVIEGDFTRAMPPAAADLAVAIESHVHAPDAATFLRVAKAHLRPGGVLVLVDDMLTRPPATQAEARLVATFRRGWRLGHVPTLEGLAAEAAALGLELQDSRDLSGLLRLDRMRDRALTVVAPLADALGLGRWPLFANMIGGNALTQAHRRGLMSYRLIVLRLPAASIEPRAPIAANRTAA
jgi:SAM-dependent methyltransferase